MNSISKCLVCKSDMEADAEKCTACDSYQDWTRYIFRYTAVATAILGIVPVIMIAISLFQIAFVEKESDVRAAIIGCGARGLDIGIVNVGEKPSIVSNLSFKSPDTQSHLTSENFSVRRTDGDGKSTYLVDTGTSKVVTYKPYEGDTPSRFPVFPKNSDSCQYHISIESIDFDSKTKNLELTCDCSRN